MKITRATVSRCLISDFFSFFSSHLDHHVELEMTYFEPVGTNIYGYSQLWVFKIWEHFCYVLEHLYFFLKFWAVKICGLQFFLYSKYVGIQSVDDQIL